MTIHSSLLSDRLDRFAFRAAWLFRRALVIVLAVDAIGDVLIAVALLFAGKPLAAMIYLVTAVAISLLIRKPVRVLRAD